MANPKVANDVLIEAYNRLGSVWKVEAETGVKGGTVHGRLRHLGVITPMNVFTDADDERLRKEYQEHADAGTLDSLALSMGRTKPFICRQARRLGLTDKNRERPYIAVWKGMPTERVAEIWADFKSSPLGMGEYCLSAGHDDLGFWRTMKSAYPDEWDHVIELKAQDGCYKTGRLLEYQVRDDLLARGYHASRSHLSKSPADVIAFKTGSLLLVQCRIGGAYSVPEWNTLYDLAKSLVGTPILASRGEGAGIQYEVMTGRKDGSRRPQPKRLLIGDWT